jgi:hypothetical protein
MFLDLAGVPRQGTWSWGRTQSSLRLAVWLHTHWHVCDGGCVTVTVACVNDSCAHRDGHARRIADVSLFLKPLNRRGEAHSVTHRPRGPGPVSECTLRVEFTPAPLYEPPPAFMLPSPQQLPPNAKAPSPCHSLVGQWPR